MNQHLKDLILSAIDSTDDFIDARWRNLKKRWGWQGTPSIQPYIGYANDDRTWMHGRVLTNPPRELPSEDDHWWDNLMQMYRRFESDEVPGVEIEIEFAGQKHRVVTDEEGYFQLELSNHRQVRDLHPWKSAGMRIVDNPDVTPDESFVTSKILTPPRSAQFGLISDIDDTVLHTGMTGLLTAVRLTFLHNARTRKPLEGVASLYRVLQHGSSGEQPQHNPVFYVSSSPWNLHDLLEDFLDLNNIPAGPILLRDLGFDENKFLKEGHEHKLAKAEKIMSAYPDLPFVLFGDSGQEDASLYAQAARRYSEQVQAIFIRDVDPDFESRFDAAVAESIELARSVDVPMYLIRDSFEAAEVLYEMSFIPERWLPHIRVDAARDHSSAGLPS